MKEEKVIRIIVIMNNLKSKINPSYNNKSYQDWKNRTLLYKKMKFRDWVINDTKKEILKLLEKQNTHKVKDGKK